MTEHPPPLTGYFFILAVLLLFSMFFSACETAFLSVNVLRIKYLERRKSKQAVKIIKILKNRQRFLTSSLIANSFVNILISVVLTSLSLKLFGSGAVGIAVTAGTILVLVFGEVVPKSVALVFPEQIALKSAKYQLFVMKILFPFSFLFSGITDFILRMFGICKTDKLNAVTQEDLKTFLESSESEGMISADEKKIMEKILNYGNASLKTIMTPRTNIKAINISDSPKEILEFSRISRMSRFPVYSENIDNIEGILYIKDFLFSENYFEYEKSEKEFDIKKYLRKPCFVFANTEPAKVQEILRENKQNMAVVVDEYGGTLGIITTEDLNEEIFGSLMDEYDSEESEGIEEIFIKITADKCENCSNEYFIVSGNLRLSKLNEELNINLKSQFHDTIGGFIMEICGQVPEEEFKIEIDNFLFTVKKITGNRIEEIIVEEKES